jgi:hypothetical protein
MKRLTCVAIVLSALVLAGFPAGASAAPKTKLLSNATVKTVAAASLTVTSADGKDMTFSVDAKSRVVGKGIGTKGDQKGKGGKAAITDLLNAGDRVNVVYQDDAAMHANSIELRAAAKK